MDRRVLPVVWDGRERRYVSLGDAMVEMKRPKSFCTDFPFDGPGGIIIELLEGRAEQWRRARGVPRACRGQHCAQSSSAHLCPGAYGAFRSDVLQINRACRRNPRAPDFKCQEIMTVSQLDSSGCTLHDDFAKWTAVRQRDEAFAF